MMYGRLLAGFLLLAALVGAYFYGRHDGKLLGEATCMEAAAERDKLADEVADLKLKNAQKSETRNRTRLADAETKTRESAKEVQDYVEAHPKDDACRLDGDDVRLLDKLVDEVNEVGR